MNRVVVLIERMNLFIGRLASWIVIPLTVVVLIEVVLRYFANNPTIWAYDTSWMLYSVFFLLGGGYTMVRKKHVRIDLIFGALPKKAQIVYELCFFIIIFLPATSILCFRSTEYALRAWKTGQSISSAIWIFPVAPIRTVMPIAFFLLALQGIAEIIRNLLLLICPSKMEDSNE